METTFIPVDSEKMSKLEGSINEKLIKATNMRSVPYITNVIAPLCKISKDHDLQWFEKKLRKLETDA